MAPPLYPAAETIAPRLFEHFRRQHEAARTDGLEALAPLPAVEVIQRVVDTAFWASLRRQEGYVPRISLAWLPPDGLRHPLRFARPLPLGALALARLAPAVERPGIHLGVWGDEDDVRVWGTTRAVPSLCFVLEVVSPGVLVVPSATATACSHGSPSPCAPTGAADRCWWCRRGRMPGVSPSRLR
jgi:hypothetical protein